MPEYGTFSIVACDLKARAWGVAVASKFLAVGAVVPWAKARAGAIATQAVTNTSFGPRGLEMMASSEAAEEVLSRLVTADKEREHRQVGMVDAEGRSASFTGEQCADWAGGLTGPGYAIQGNVLTGAEVVRQMEHAFLEAKAELPERLFAALTAGGQAGGDRRGRQSAAILVVKPKAGYGGHDDRWIDLRVDDHINPIPRLGELLELHRLFFRRGDKKDRVRLEGEVVTKIQAIMKGLGYYTPVDGQYDDATREAFRAFIHNENLEKRADPDAGWIDGPALDYLIRRLK
ncbi:MAG TPA: DUF1028 domain-containing protein [Anaerolineales bacterium]|nr:DUF1028 domain-containing protein [Anaerolineales bacterium]